MPLMGSLLDWTWLRKESVNLKRCQQKLTKQKKTEKDKQSIQELWANYKRCNKSVIGNTRRRIKKGNNNG